MSIMRLPKFDPIELEIVETFVDLALEAGHRISVYDQGEDCLVLMSINRTEILRPLFITEMNRLRILTPIGKHIGDVVLIYCHQEHVIAHWSDSHEINELIRRTNATMDHAAA